MDNKKLQNTWKKFRINKDKKYLKKLVEHYYETLVIKIAKSLERKLRYKIPVNELASHGVSGLYKAIDSYDVLRGVRFETYSYSRIWGSMIDGLREEDRVPRSVHIRQSKINNEKHKLETLYGYRISDQDAVKHAGFSVNDYYKNRSKFNATFSTSIESNTNDIDTEENKKDFNEYLVAKNESSAGSRILRKEFLNKLIGKNFTQMERKIIYYYYYEKLSMREIAKDLNVSESRISQIHQLALKRLKDRIKFNPEYFDSNVLEIINKCNDKDSLL